MSIAFTAPSTGGNALKPADIEGHLLVVEPHEYRQNVPTSMGESDAVQVTVHDITNGSTHEDVLWFSRVLVGSLKNRIGHRILGVMGKGEAKSGQSAPWILLDASAEPKAVKAATDYLVAQVSDSLTQPAASDTDDLVAALATLGAKPAQ
jgi:hypothetical protein